MSGLAGGGATAAAADAAAGRCSMRWLRTPPNDLRFFNTVQPFLSSSMPCLSSRPSMAAVTRNVWNSRLDSHLATKASWTATS